MERKQKMQLIFTYVKPIECGCMKGFTCTMVQVLALRQPKAALDLAKLTEMLWKLELHLTTKAVAAEPHCMTQHLMQLQVMTGGRMTQRRVLWLLAAP